MDTPLKLSDKQLLPEKAKTEIQDRFAVIDTETNWDDEVMSVGVVVADTKTKKKN